jgi:hypothetical protein
MATTMSFALPALWRERANYLREYGHPACGRLWELAARELEESLAVHGDETLSLVEAAKVSGFTPDHLRSLIKRGTLPNAGRKGAARIRRSDLPVKRVGGPGRPTRALTADADRQHIRRVAHSFNKEKRR